MSTAMRSAVSSYSYFFREPEALTLVAREVLAKRKSAVPPSIWSVGCSTGEEAYSLAILAAEMRCSADILGTDVSTALLDKARAASYAATSLRHVGAARLDAWFTSSRGRHALRPTVRSLVRFAEHDLRKEQVPRNRQGLAAGCWDAILCRNVFLYLSTSEVGDAMELFCRALAPGGLLLLGCAEWVSTKHLTNSGHCRQLELVDFGAAWAYLRRDGMAARHRGCEEPPRHEIPRGAPIFSCAAEPEVAARCAPSSPSVAGARKSNGGAAAEQLRRRGDALLAGADAEGALSAYLLACSASPLLPDLHLRIAICYLQLGQRQLAVEALKRCLFLADDIWPAAFLLGDLLFEEEPSVAVRYFRQAAALLEGDAGPRGRLHGGELAPFLVAESAAAEVVRQRIAMVERAV
jgi:chemotaxis protein methyltransferase CheR